MNTSRDRFHVLDRDSMDLVREVVGKLGSGLWDSALHVPSRRIYTSGWGSNTVAVLDGVAADRLGLIATDVGIWAMHCHILEHAAAGVHCDKRLLLHSFQYCFFHLL